MNSSQFSHLADSDNLFIFDINCKRNYNSIFHLNAMFSTRNKAAF